MRTRLALALCASLVVAAGCGGTSAPVTSSPPTACPLGARAIPYRRYPMLAPPAGSTGVSTGIGAISIPNNYTLRGQPVQLLTPTAPLTGGTFVPQPDGTLRATIPPLQPLTTYQAYAYGIAPCPPGSPFYDFGSFTTGP